MRAACVAAGMAVAVALCDSPRCDLLLVETGAPKATVVCATQTDRAAADEFVAVVERISGAKLPIADSADTGPRVLIGEAARAAVDPAKVAALSFDGYLIRCRGDILAITGRTPNGTVNGVCGFLQDHLGARWFMPSELFEVLPHLDTIRVRDCDETQAPSFDCRLFSGLDGQQQAAWRLHLRLSPSDAAVPFEAAFSHNLYRLFPPSRFAQSDPEIYPLINSERAKPTSDEHPPWQPCTANPRTVELAIQEINRYFDENPQAHTYSVSINDNDGWCECDLCRAVDVPHEFRGKQVHSDRYYTFVNAVALGVREKHPDKLIGGFAYWGVEPPPKTIPRLEPNVFIDITQDTSQYFDRKYREQDYAFWRQWQAKCKQMGKYDYTGLGALAPRYYPHLLAEDLRHSKRIGLVAMHAEAYPYWANYGPMVYLQARMMWDATLNEDALLAEFFDKLYGPAAPEMAAFYDELEQAWMTPRPGRWFAGIGSAKQQCEIYTLDGLARLQAHLRSAARLAPEGVIADRVAYIRRCFEYPALFIGGWLEAQAIDQAQDPAQIGPHLTKLLRLSRDRDAAFRRSILEDDLSTHWYDEYAGREGVQAEWRAAVEGAILRGMQRVASARGAGGLDELIGEVSARDPESPLLLLLRAQRGDFDALPNLAPNPGFEETEGGDNPSGPEWVAKDAPPGWSVWRESPAAGRLFRDTQVVRAGKQSAALRGGKCMCYITRVPVTPGRQYVGWAYARADNVTAPRRTTFEIRWNDAQGRWHAPDRQATAPATEAGTWTRLIAAATAPDGAASAVLLLVVYDIADEETAWFDDVFFAEVPPEGGNAQMAPNEVFHTVVGPVGPQNPRNSEAAIVPLQDGSLLLGWTEFYAGSGADHGPARLVGRISRDAGRTWGEKYTLVENDGGCNVMEVNFMRLRSGALAVFYCQKNSEDADCRIMMRTSTDEGRTFGPARQLSPAAKYTGLTNGRCIRLTSGRILLEAWEGGDSYCCLSDDDGQTWRDSARVKPEGGPCYEPACIELKDGRVLMLMRTGLGSQFRSLSADGGETWTKPEPTALTCSASPVSISRIPTTGDLLAIWNHDTDSAVKRSPLTAAISRDEGETWEHFRNLEDAPGDRWAYPAVTWLGDQALITYFNYTGGLSLQLKIVRADWFYQ